MLTITAPAHAATVSVDEFTRVALFVDRSGQRNDLTVTAGRNVTFRDTDAVLRAGKGCRRLDVHTAVCAGVKAVDSRLGDGSDAYRLRQRTRRPSVRAWGGRGPDQLTGGSFKDLLKGDRGADRLLGGGGWDWLVGGRGDDFLSGGPGWDRLVPGPGGDTVPCGTRPADDSGEDDWVIDPEPGELLTDACELAVFYVDGPLFVQVTPTPVAYPSNGPAFVLRCPTTTSEYEDTPHCGGSLEVRHNDRVIGSASFPANWYEHSVAPAYTQEGRRLAERPGGVRATADLVAAGYSVSWTLRLKL